MLQSQTEKTPDQIIEEAKQNYNINKFVGLFSGGKDSLAVCHYLWRKQYLDEVLYCDTGIKAHENFEFVLSTCNKYNWKLNVVSPKKGETYEDFVRKFGFPHRGIHSAIMGYLKWHPIRKWARGNQDVCFVSGRRKKESKRRMRLQKYIEKPEKNILVCSPLFYWTTSQVWDYIRTSNLESCPVYQTLHISGDCLCGSFAEKGEAELIATFHPELAKQIRSLETEHGGIWGNGSSLTGALKQSKIADFICSECIYQRN